MRKKDTLYTANKWNKPLFMPNENLFFNGGLAAWDRAASKALGAKYGDEGNTLDDYMKSTNILGISKADNPFSKGNLAGGLGAMAKTPIGGSLISSAAGAVGGLAGGLIGGGLHSGAGDAIGSIGSTVGSAVGAVNPLLGAAVGVGSQILGGLTNAAFGTKVDEAKLNAAKEGTSQLNNFTSNAGSFDDVQGIQSVANVQDAYEGGWFTSGDAKRKNEELKRQRQEAMAFAQNSILNNVNNIAEDQINNALANYSAFGGPIDTLGMGAIDYGFMSDYLATKKKQADDKNKMTNMFMGTPSTLFAIGGDMQTNGGDFSSGLTHVDAGGTHEESPYDGVQMGVDQNGVPNLVEEDETVYNDYVYSNRITLDQAAKEKFHFPKKKDITYAEATKKLEKEIAERVNDPISQAGFKAQMEALAEEQERQKQEMEAERAKAAFEALSPEEQVAVMESAAQQEQAAQQAAMQQEAMAQQQAQPSPEEQAMMQQQMMQADGSQAMVGQEAPMMAEGGNLFKSGGKKNQGAWKNKDENHWDRFTRPGLLKYIESIKERLDNAKSEEEKNAIRQDAMKSFNALQQSYFQNIVPTRGAANQTYDDAVLGHQDMFDRMYGNTGFFSTDEKGNRKNLIEEAINMPKGHNTADKPDHWVDGYNGPRTSIRNFGSTEYGDDAFYKSLADKFKELGLVYAPNEDWTYDDNELYGLSMADAVPTEPALSPEGEPELVVDYGDYNPNSPGTPAQAPAQTPADAANRGIGPRLRAEWPRYIGLLGPAVGLGLQAAGVGRPDTGMLDAALEGSGNVALARAKYLGDYERYTPLDRMFHTNQLMANARATDRALLNTTSPSRAAGLLANNYNTTIGLGNLARQGEEYNDALYHRTKEFNRGTNQYNADAYNRLSQFNAGAINSARQHKGSLSLQAAAQKMDADAGWYNGIYGNVAGLFKGLSDLGRENANRNMVARMWADGLAGTATPDTYSASDYLTWDDRKKSKKAKGGKNHKKHDIIL